MTGPSALCNRRVLIPRGGAWGCAVADELRAFGAEPVVAPLIGFRAPSDPAALSAALTRLAEGRYEWLTVTSATTVSVLREYGAVVPSHTRIAAVGHPTATALRDTGYVVSLIPDGDHSARGLLRTFAERDITAGPVLVLASELAKPLLAEGLAAAGFIVDRVGAYRTVPVRLTEHIRDALRRGAIDAVLVTSGSVAEQLLRQTEIAPNVTLAAIGDHTAADARLRGLRVQVESTEQSASGLIRALENYYRTDESVTK